MRFVGVRELARGVSHFLEQVKSTGEPLVVTRHGRPIATVHPADEDGIFRGATRGTGRPRSVEDLPPFVRSALRELRTGLAGLYGDRLRGLFVFGSYARGEADPEGSDLDVAIVLDRAGRSGEDIDRTTHLVYEALTRWGILLNTLFVDVDSWERSERGFIPNARRDALVA